MAGDEEGAGHRARLRERLLRQGSDALLDHEIVEYLLALVIPRRDTKSLAKRLLNEFGGIGGLFAADAEAIERAGFSETVVAALKIVNAAALRLLAAEIKDRPVLNSWNALLDYLRADMAALPIERVRVLFLDAKNKLIRNEAFSEGTTSEAAMYAREVIRRAIDLHASSLILVHNHPSGDPSPSKQDIAVTRDIVEAGKRLGIAVHDHVIVGASGHSSMRASGLL
jgi:DNA repair protein RadC